MVKTKLGNISNITYGKGLPTKKLLKSGYPVFGANGQIGFYDKYLFENEQLLISCRGAYSGKINFSTKKCFITNNSLVIDFSIHKIQLRKYYYYILQGANKTHIVTGSAQPQVTINNAVTLELPIVPLPEQRAIVSKIEQLFSELDNGINNLKTAKEKLKIYRQAVLKKAFEGELTKEWRKQRLLNGEKLPTADELLEQIKTERENHYQNQLKEWKQKVKVWEENGKEGKKPGKPKKDREVIEMSENEIISKGLKIIPNIWKWVKLGSIFQVFVGSTPSRKKSSYWEHGNVPWVRSGEVTFNRIKDTKEKITKLGLDNSSTIIHPIGTVMLAMIGEGKTRGQSAILDIKACHNQNTAAIRVSEKNSVPEYLFHYLFFRYQRNRRIGSGNNQKALNQGRIMEFDFPLCSKNEQTQIVQEIETRLSVTDKIEETIEENLKKAEALRQSILKKAFEGRLLSNAEIELCKKEPDYEPAEKLLARIKKEKN